MTDKNRSNNQQDKFWNAASKTKVALAPEGSTVRKSKGSFMFVVDFCKAFDPLRWSSSELKYYSFGIIVIEWLNG